MGVARIVGHCCAGRGSSDLPGLLNLSEEVRASVSRAHACFEQSLVSNCRAGPARPWPRLRLLASSEVNLCM